MLALLAQSLGLVATHSLVCRAWSLGLVFLAPCLALARRARSLVFLLLWPRGCPLWAPLWPRRELWA